MTKLWGQACHAEAPPPTPPSGLASCVQVLLFVGS